MHLAIADPPYLGQGARHYGHQHPEAGRWDDPQAHLDLIAALERDCDGWVYACHTPSLRAVLGATDDAVRVGVWVKTSASNTSPYVRTGFRHEFVLFRQARTTGRWSNSNTDVLHAGIVRGSDVVGTKPGRWTHWCLDLMGYEAGDTVDDLFPGSGAVTRAIATYRPGCAVCGKHLPRRSRMDKRFCSNACRQKYWRENTSG